MSKPGVCGKLAYGLELQKHPPIGTCLYSLVVPPVGGNTGFANQQMALAQMPGELRQRLEDKVALHSAAAAYGPQERMEKKTRAMIAA